MRERVLETYRLGVDIGSTTMKVALLDKSGNLVFSDYRRHNANIPFTAKSILQQMWKKTGNSNLKVCITGSVGMGFAEKSGYAFVQEVVASAEFIRQRHPEVHTFVDIGGEDSKMIFFEDGKIPDIRMNGSCAGGTGAFIDQTASLLGVEPVELSRLAESNSTIYPIASRCGVFSKTDIQNLVSRSVSRADIAASVFHAVAMQVVGSLARGTDILPKVFFCGGPFAYLPALKKSFMDVLQLSEDDCVLPENAQLIPATGCALLAGTQSVKDVQLDELLYILRFFKQETPDDYKDRLPALFQDDKDYDEWLESKNWRSVPKAAFDRSKPCFLGVDSGSTTTKIVLLDDDGNLVYRDYRKNSGDSFATFSEAMRDMYAKLGDLDIKGTAATGYGENLLKTAFNLDYGIVETIAHFSAAKQVDPDVSFVLDIGGQDMKAIFIENGSIKRIEINEACSSGCGSFIETFANMLGYNAADFALMACKAKHPCDLGTRCTVFMNSKVKQAMREGADISDIAAGFSYSVIKNCLFKVLKLKTVKELGDNIVVQGGTFKNHSIVRALELLTGKQANFADIPELMGAYGAALYAKGMSAKSGMALRPLAGFVSANRYEASTEVCKGCENHCTVKAFTFANGNTFYSGNNCEKIYSNKSENFTSGVNMYVEKYRLLFGRRSKKGGMRIGIPRALGIYENYPFWHTYFTELGFEVVLSGTSSDKLYAKGVRTIMADNICFPAKLMHGHVASLVEQKVDRIFYPYVVYEYKEDPKSKNSFNCPIVTGYSDVIKSAVDTYGRYGIPMDSPVISFNDYDLLEKACVEYFKTLGVAPSKAKAALAKATDAQRDYLKKLTQRGVEVLRKAEKEDRMVILLAGRPYHCDPYIEHKISHAIADMGIDVITENAAAELGKDVYDDLLAVSQWAYPNRIFKAAGYVARYKGNLHYVELTSFGCGPDAFILDEVGSVLHRNGKNLTLLKIDDVNNIGSLRLRVRSLVESLRLDRSERQHGTGVSKPQFPKIFGEQDKKRTILAPYFAEGYSEFLPSLFKTAGYKIVNLPMGNQSSADTGLKYANNEVCYPATICIGSIINALQSGKYDLDETAVIITQTGGQCRATNYYSLLRNAVVEAGFKDVPVLSLELGSSMGNNQPGWKIEWKKVAKLAIYTLVYADCLQKLYYPAAAREKTPGAAKALKNRYTEGAFAFIERKDYKGLENLLRQAAGDFAAITDCTKKAPQIGVVGEIYVKYNAFSNMHVVEWLVEQGVEVVPPCIYNFFTQSIVNHFINKRKHIKKNPMPTWVVKLLHTYVRHVVAKFDKICSPYPYYRKFSNIFNDEKLAGNILNTAANFGEGWLIPAEISNLAEHGVNNVVSLQPFGCIANHIISKGIEKKVKQIYPKMNMLCLDFDSSTSEANVYNRLHFMVENSKKML